MVPLLPASPMRRTRAAVADECGASLGYKTIEQERHMSPAREPVHGAGEPGFRKPHLPVARWRTGSDQTPDADIAYAGDYHHPARCRCLRQLSREKSPAGAEQATAARQTRRAPRRVAARKRRAEKHGATTPVGRPGKRVRNDHAAQTVADEIQFGFGGKPCGEPIRHLQRRLAPRGIHEALPANAVTAQPTGKHETFAPGHEQAVHIQNRGALQRPALYN